MQNHAHSASAHFAAVALAASLLTAALPARANYEDARTEVVVTLDHLYSEFQTAVDAGINLDDVVIDKLRSGLLPKLDVDRFMKLILARHWKKASEQQRAEFTEILTEFLLRSFAVALVGNKEKVTEYYQRIEVLPARKGRKEGRAAVTMEVRGDSGVMEIDFKLSNSDDGWKVYDIVFEGVSFAINYRAILHSEISKHGFDEVTRTLSERLARVQSSN